MILWEVLLFIGVFGSLVLWLFAVLIADDNDVPMGLKLFYGLFFVMTIVGLITADWQREQENKDDCQSQGGMYRSVYKSSDECIKDGKIIKVYN